MSRASLLRVVGRNLSSQHEFASHSFRRSLQPKFVRCHSVDRFRVSLRTNCKKKKASRKKRSATDFTASEQVVSKLYYHCNTTRLIHCHSDRSTIDRYSFDNVRSRNSSFRTFDGNGNEKTIALSIKRLVDGT